MRQLVATVVTALLAGAATYAGVRLMQAVSDPYSDLRLRGSEILDHLRG